VLYFKSFKAAYFSLTKVDELLNFYRQNTFLAIIFFLAI